MTGLKPIDMKFEKPIPIKTIAGWIGAEILGPDDGMATGLNEIHKVVPGDIMFVDFEKYYKKSLNSAASFVIINQRVDVPEGKTLLYHEEPFEAYNSLALKLRPPSPIVEGVSPGANIHPTARIEPGAIIADHVSIGAHSEIHANVVIHPHCVIGDHVVIQAGTIIGSDAFYYKKTAQGFKQWHSIGRVVIEDHVTIGAGCTINKGVSGDTVVGEGSKLDCQIHIGHGVVIGKHCLMAGQVGIGGKTIIGDWVTIYGQVGITQNLHIGDRVTIMAKSGVGMDLEAGKAYFGAPAAEARSEYRKMAYLNSLYKKSQDGNQ